MGMRVYRLTRKIHRWTSIAFGTALLVWVFSAIVWILPHSALEWIDCILTGARQGQTALTESLHTTAASVPEKASYRSIAISVPEAISVLEGDLEHAIHVTDCSILRFSDAVMYEFTLEDGERHLIDATRGALVSITEAQIRESAMAAAPPGGSIADMTLLTQRPDTYWGPMPTYRFVFDDVSRTHVYVSAATGRVELASQGWNRLRDRMLSLHKFEFLLSIYKREAFRKAVLLILSLIGLVALMTGFYLALPIPWLRRLPGN